jgi:para-aminobenzoate synthetase component I
MASPLVIRQPLDLPPGRLAAVIGTWREPALLESGPGFGEAGRWSLLAAYPRRVFEATGTSWTVRNWSRLESSGDGTPWEPLAALLRRFGLADPSDTPDPDLPPFQGGLIGFFGYDLAPTIERLPRKAPRDSRMPDLRFGLYDTVVTVDHATGAVELWAHDLLGEGRAAVEGRAGLWCRALSRPARSRRPRSRLGPLESNFSEAAYLEAVGRALEYVAAGDIFQVNLSQRFTARGQPEPLDLYLRLKQRSPSPFGCFLRWDDFAVVGASPEWFYQTRGRRIVTRPIKGTRPRGRTPGDDARLAAELAASPKDRAELTMIVDLERNDLGRVCRYGTVEVVEPGTVESFAQVHHLVATVQGQLWPSVGPVDVVKAVFPGGSITGAPKIRAMQIIDELEPTRRGLYTGAVGYFTRGGSALNIAIRTLLVEGERVSFQVGGGIVADSDPETEYHETLHKGRGLREVLGESGR